MLDAAVSAIRAVSLVLLGNYVVVAGALATQHVVGRDVEAAGNTVFWLGVVAIVAGIIATVVAVPLGMALVRLDLVAAAPVVASSAGFVVGLQFDWGDRFAAVCGAISILVGVVFANDSAVRRTTKTGNARP